MKLSNVARMFDTCPVYDAYSGVLLFKIQTSTFLESSLEGSTASRRVISLAPDLVVPAHSCLLILGELVVVGRGNADEWGGEQIRKAYWTKVVTDDFRLLTPAQAALAQTGTPVFGQRKFFKETSNAPTESEFDTYWQIFISESLNPVPGYVFKSGTSFYRVRTAYADVDGFRTCHCDELDSGPVLVTVTTDNIYNPVTDTMGPSYLQVYGIPMPFAKAFSHKTASDYKAEVGDIAIVVAKSSLGPEQGMELTISTGSKYAGTWRVHNILDEADGWNLHLRRR